MTTERNAIIEECADVAISFHDFYDEGTQCAETIAMAIRALKTAEQDKFPPEPQRYVQMGSAMVPAFNTFDGKPSGPWIESKDYDALLALLTKAREA